MAERIVILEMEKIAPKISVIIPVYNTEKYLRECLDSVINQTLKDIEIICIDDGSTDSSLNILREYAQKDSRIIVLTRQNKGAGAARNAGLKIAKGEYLSFLDSDDVFMPKMLEAMYDYSQKGNVDICICDAEGFDMVSKKKFAMPWLINLETGYYKTNALYDNLFKYINPNCWNKIFKREFIINNKIKFQNLNNANDVFFVWFALALSKDIGVLKEKYIEYKYKIPGSISASCGKNPYNIYVALITLKNKLLKYKQKEIIPALYKASISHFIYAIKQAPQNKDLEKILKKYIKFFSVQNLSYIEKVKEAIALPIVFATDDNYAKYLSVTMISILDNANKKDYFKFFVLHSNSLSKNNIDKISKIQKKYKNVTINFISISRYIEGIPLYSKAHYSNEMWYRILIPELFKNYPTVLYLDSDLIVNDNIAKIFNENNIDNFCICGIKNYCNEGMYKYVEEKLQLNPDNYFNSGVILFNTKECINFNLKQKCFKLIKKYNNLSCPDQDILNLVCQNKVNYIDPKWNFMWQHLFTKEMKCPHLVEKYKPLYDLQQKNFSIIHYTSRIKPWKNIDYKYASLWWKYAKMSPYYSNLKKEKQNLFTKKICQNIFSLKNDDIHKVLTVMGIKFKFKSKNLIVNKRFKDIDREFNNIKKILKNITKENENLYNIINNITDENENLIKNISSKIDSQKIECNKKLNKQKL